MMLKNWMCFSFFFESMKILKIFSIELADESEAMNDSKFEKLCEAWNCWEKTCDCIYCVDID